jgi:hypothetical protein
MKFKFTVLLSFRNINAPHTGIIDKVKMYVPAITLQHNVYKAYHQTELLFHTYVTAVHTFVFDTTNITSINTVHSLYSYVKISVPSFLSANELPLLSVNMKVTFSKVLGK